PRPGQAVLAGDVKRITTEYKAPGKADSSRRDVPAIGPAGDLLERPGQDPAGADLIETVAARVEQAAKGPLPEDRLDDLSRQGGLYLADLSVGFGRDVRPHPHARLPQRHGGEGGREPFDGRLHDG